MSGFEIIGLLGLTGNLEQCAVTVQRLRNHYRNFKQNITTIDNLYDALQQNHTKLQRLNSQITTCNTHLSQNAIETINDTIFKVNQDIKNAYESLKQLENTVTSKGMDHVLKASKVAADCTNIQQSLEKTDISLVQLIGSITVIEATISIADAQTDERQRPTQQQSTQMSQSVAQASSSNTTGDNFNPQKQLQPHTRGAIPNFSQTDQRSNPITVEGKIKHRLLTPSHKPGNTILSILGEAGVGKTTTLHMLCHEPDIQRHFHHGIYYMSLGADASTDTVVQQLRRIVRTTGGVKLARDTEKWTSISQAIQTTSEWFQDKTFLMLIDDVWNTAAVGNHLQDILTQIVLTSPGAAVVFTTRNADVAIHGEYFKLRRKEPQSQESRSMLMRHAGYPDDSRFDEKAEDAIADILEKTAGLAVAHSVAGKAVRVYDASSDSGISPWVRYTTMNKSIIKGDGDRYSSLDIIFSTALRTLEVNNTRSSASELFGLTTEDYMRMHRSLCVFEKQQWILIPVLVRLWRLEESVVKSVCEEYVKIGLAERHDEQLQDEITVEGIMIHDLLHDFATEQAKKHETVEKWHDELVTEYSKEAGVEENEKCYSWWKLKDVDHGYVMKNLFRHLLRSDCKERAMKYVVSRPQWIGSQLVANGIILYEKDVWLATEQNERKNDLNDQLDVSNALLGKVLDAGRLSFSYICNNPGEVWFQLYGRLMKAKESVCLKGYLHYIEENAPRPWLKPVSECLTGVDAVGQQLIYVNKSISCTSVVPGKDEIVCGCYDGSIRIVDIEQSQVRRKWKAHEDFVSAICVSPSGRFIVSGCKDSTVKLWDSQSGKQMGTTMLGHSDRMTSVAVSRDECTVYTRSEDGSVLSWDADTLEQKSVLVRLSTNINFYGFQLGVLADENLIVGYSADGHEEVMKISVSIPRENKKETKKEKGLKRILRQVGSHLPRLGKLREGEEVADEAEFECAFEITTLQKNCSTFALSGDGSMLVTQNEDHDLNIWNGKDTMKIGKIRRTGGSVELIALDNDRKHIATLDIHGTITVYEGKGDREGTYQTVSAWNIQSIFFAARGLQFTGDGEQVAVCILSGIIRVFDVGKATSEQVQETQKMSLVSAVAATPNGEFFVTGHWSGEIKMWDTRTGELSIPFLSVNQDRVDGIGISENGEWLVTLSIDGMVAVWNMRTRNLKISFKIQNDRYLGLDVSCDGTRVVLQIYDGMIQMWDTCNTEQPLLVIPQEKRTTAMWRDVYFRKDSLRIAAVSETCIEEWDTPSGSCIQSRKFTESYLYFSREDIFKILSYPERQDANKPHGLFLDGNEIRYGRNKSYRVLATLEHGSIFAESYSVKSQALCVRDRGDFQMFHLHKKETENTS